MFIITISNGPCCQRVSRCVYYSVINGNGPCCQRVSRCMYYSVIIAINSLLLLEKSDIIQGGYIDVPASWYTIANI